ncbi:MAG: hypothetical protein ABR505_07925, partial [Actinomycetota bacterium]
MRRTWLLRLTAALMAFALIGAACNSDTTETTTGAETEAPASDETTDEMTEVDVPSVDTAAATLTRDLAGLLADHEYLAGLAVLMGVTAGADSAEFEAAAGALDKNSVQLSEAVGSVYGDAGAK